MKDKTELEFLVDNLAVQTDHLNGLLSRHKSEAEINHCKQRIKKLNEEINKLEQ